jgi:steroid delta-isomerase-like uncharacterized protein
MSETNKQLMLRWFQQVWNEHNEAAIDEMVHVECLVHNLPETGAVLVGPAGFKEVHRNFCGAFPDIHVVIEDVISEGDRVAAHWTATMTHPGDHLGIPPTGKNAVLPGSSFCIVRDGKIAEAWNHIDMGHLFKQLETV